MFPTARTSPSPSVSTCPWRSPTLPLGQGQWRSETALANLPCLGAAKPLGCDRGLRSCGLRSCGPFHQAFHRFPVYCSSPASPDASTTGSERSWSFSVCLGTGSVTGRRMKRRMWRRPEVPPFRHEGKRRGGARCCPAHPSQVHPCATYLENALLRSFRVGPHVRLPVHLLGHQSLRDHVCQPPVMRLRLAAIQILLDPKMALEVVLRIRQGRGQETVGVALQVATRMVEPTS
mmetsp:Transcript_19628/g.52831  ORF Transcript_19628/g.52831 Transcript_19628/m.52831 type:complete len:233 (+) Transcript_19628:247-945(+)